MSLSLFSVVFIVLLAAILVIASVSTTILGWVAVAQIRRSAGRLYGLGLALFDGLLFPLLALDALIGWLGFLGWSRNYDATHNAPFVLFTCVIVDFLIVRAVWRAVRPPSMLTAKMESAPAAAGSSSGYARLALGLLLASLLGTPLLMAFTPFALAFGALALLLALVFGIIGSPSRLARGVLIAVLTLLVIGGAGLYVIFYMRNAAMQTATRNREFARRTVERVRQVRFQFSHPDQLPGGIKITLRAKNGTDGHWTPSGGQPLSLKDGKQLEFRARLDASTPGSTVAWVSTKLNGKWEASRADLGAENTSASLDFANGLHVSVSLLEDESSHPEISPLPAR